MVWNELAGCKVDVPRLPCAAFEEVYAVDDGSTDGTAEYLAACGILVYRQPTSGLNAAYLYATACSTCDAVVVYFPKGSIPPEDVLKFRPLLEAGNDLVIASRNIHGAHNEEDGKFIRPRKWCVLGLAALAALLWRREGHFVRDVLHGVKGFTASGMRRMRPGGEGLSIDIEMVVHSYRLRLPRAEFPTTEHLRLHGSTKFGILPTGFKLLQYLWRELWQLASP
jgi:glycosyltransferase involved in cell wall biosynthesis